jgi:hypothetical protein
MKPHDQFWTEEFYRYSAECRRLARLAQNPKIVPEGGVVLSYRRWANWLRDVPAQYVKLPTPRPQFVTGRQVWR